MELKFILIIALILIGSFFGGMYLYNYMSEYNQTRKQQDREAVIFENYNHHDVVHEVGSSALGAQGAQTSYTQFADQPSLKKQLDQHA